MSPGQVLPGQADIHKNALMDILQDIKSLHEKLQTEVQETFADVLGSVSKDPAKNTGTRHLKLTISIDTQLEVSWITLLH